MTNSQCNTNPLIIEANPRRGQVVAAEPTSQDQLFKEYLDLKNVLKKLSEVSKNTNQVGCT